MHPTGMHSCYQECIPVGCVLSAAVAMGVSTQVGVCQTTPSPVDRMTDTRENITFPQLLLRTVKMKWSCINFILAQYLQINYF